MREHWFDNVSKSASRSTTRREASHSLAALLSGLLLGGLIETASGMPEGKGIRKRSANEKGKRKQGSGKDEHEVVKAAAGDECSATWPGSGKRARRNRRHCRFIRRQCDGNDPRDFCIIENFPGHEGEKVAVCCEEDETCCFNECIPRASDSDLKCCLGRVRDTSVNPNHCGSCNHQCAVGQVCEDGRCVCIGGPCDPACPVGLTYCAGECVDTLTDPRHCGGCHAFNPNGLTCCNGNLCHYIDGLCCGGTCYPGYYTSCP